MNAHEHNSPQSELKEATSSGGLASAANAAPSQAVHEAIMRTVRPQREQEFEALIEKFFKQAADQPGVLGAYLIRPFAGSSSHQYGILRSFNTAQDRDQFYGSELYRQWSEAVAPLVEGEPQRQHLHGLEAFFPTPGGPPLWKMALITWVAVNLAVYFFASLVPMVLPGLPKLAEFLLVNGLVVVVLTWVLMPILTKLLSRWLSPAR